VKLNPNGYSRSVDEFWKSGDPDTFDGKRQTNTEPLMIGRDGLSVHLVYRFGEQKRVSFE